MVDKLLRDKVEKLSQTFKHEHGDVCQVLSYRFTKTIWRYMQPDIVDVGQSLCKLGKVEGQIQT